MSKQRPSYLWGTALGVIFLLSGATVAVGEERPLEVMPGSETDKELAEQLNVKAQNSYIAERSKPFVILYGFGPVTRKETCLDGADCSQRPVTAGNYLSATERAPWAIYMTYRGPIASQTQFHEKGALTGQNVIEAPMEAIRPGGLHVRGNSLGSSTQIIR
ncbi:MAG: hypothetical protein AAF530_25165 [Pseudomonadota bacterium]